LGSTATVSTYFTATGTRNIAAVFDGATTGTSSITVEYINLNEISVPNYNLASGSTFTLRDPLLPLLTGSVTLLEPSNGEIVSPHLSATGTQFKVLNPTGTEKLVVGTFSSPQSYTGGQLGDIGIFFKVVGTDRQYIATLTTPLETVLYLDQNIGEKINLFMPDGTTGGIGEKIPSDPDAPSKIRYRVSITKGNGAGFIRKDASDFTMNTTSLTSTNELVVGNDGYLYIGEEWRVHAINSNGQRRLLFQFFDHATETFKTAVPYIIS
jgi:hypothetical protein